MVKIDKNKLLSTDFETVQSRFFLIKHIRNKKTVLLLLF